VRGYLWVRLELGMKNDDFLVWSKAGPGLWTVAKVLAGGYIAVPLTLKFYVTFI